MDNSLFLGIDLGTSGVKMGLIDSGLKVVKTLTKKYPLYLDGNKSEQKPSEWWDAVKEGIKEFPLDLRQRIKSISFSGQMHGMVLVDKNGEVLRNAILWNDSRTTKETEYLNRNIGIKQLLEYTGNIAFEGFTAPKVLWVKANEPTIFNRIHKILLPKDYLIFRFCGQYATEPSDASGTLYFDVRNKTWSNNMLKILGISENQLPKLFRSSEVVDLISSNISDELGLNKDVKIIAGGGDQPANGFALGMVNEGDACISLGTSGVIYFATDKFSATPNGELHSFASMNNKYFKMGVTLNASGSLQWFAENILEDLDFKKLLSNLNWDRNDTPVFLPYLTGERAPINDAYSTGGFLGLKRHHTKEDMLQGIIEGVTFSLKHVMESIEDQGIELKKLYITGGGTNSNFWLELISSLLDKEINLINSDFGPFYGAALAAYVGFNNIDPSSIKKLINLESTKIFPVKHPDKLFIKIKKYEIWKQFYEQTKSLSKKLSEGFENNELSSK